MPRKPRAAPAAKRRRTQGADDADAPPQGAPELTSADAPATDARWRALPIDVLQVVASFVPMRPRLLVFSAVCKRWREAARRAPIDLPGLRPASYGAACKFFVNITSLTLENAVELRQDAYYAPIRDATASISTLTSLSVLNLLWRNSHYPYVFLLQPLLAANRSSLASLSLELGDASRPAMEMLLNTDLPALRSLSLNWIYSSAGGCVDVVSDALKKLAPQLTCLSLISTFPSEALLKAVQALRFPLVTRLTLRLWTHLGGLRVSRPLFLADIESIAAAAPSATALDVGDNSDFVTGKWRALHTHVILRHAPSKNFSIYDYANVTSLEVEELKLLGPLPHPLPNVRTLRVATTPFVPLRDWTTLFTHLTSLHFMRADSLMHFAEAVERILQSSLPLRHMSYTVGEYHTPSGFARKQVAPLLARLEAHGLETLCLHLLADTHYAKLVPLAQPLTWLRMTVWVGP